MDRISELLDELYEEVRKQKPNALGVEAYRRHESDQKECAYWGHPIVKEGEPEFEIADNLMDTTNLEKILVCLGELNECNGVVGDDAARAFFLASVLMSKSYAW